jgi:hypothetical protein
MDGHDKTPPDGEELLQRATKHLGQSVYPLIRVLRCTVDGSGGKLTVLLEGSLPSFYLKQTAQEVLMRHGIPVKNRVSVLVKS